MEIIVLILIGVAVYVAFNWKKWKAQREVKKYLKAVNYIIDHGTDAPSDIITEGWENDYKKKEQSKEKNPSTIEFHHKFWFIEAYKKYAFTNDGSKAIEAYLNRKNFDWYRKPYQPKEQKATPQQASNVID